MRRVTRLGGKKAAFFTDSISRHFVVYTEAQTELEELLVTYGEKSLKDARITF